ncbi:MAG: 4a-hydroxytetrahydrobiopterin dehydratase [Planctomycetota bacterium]
MSDLADRKCVPCRGGVPPLSQEEVDRLLIELDGWQAQGAHHIFKEYPFSNFAKALEFVNHAGAVAEKQNHHPDISFGWGKARVEIYTHKIDGLTESDFILAAKIDGATNGGSKKAS